MDEQFDIQVSDVTKKEFTQAGSEMIRGLVGPAFLAVAVVTIVIMMFLGDYSLKAFLPPFVIVGALLLIAWLMVSRGYKDFPKDITFSYLIDVEGGSSPWGRNPPTSTGGTPPSWWCAARWCCCITRTTAAISSPAGV